MSKARYPHRLKDLGAFAAALALATFVAACGPQETTTSPTDETSTDTADAGWTVTPVAPAASELPAPTDALDEAVADTPEQALIKRIAKETDLFTIYWMIKKYEQSEERPEGILEALTKRRDELVEAHGPQAAIDGKLDFVTFDFRKEGDEYAARWYFIVKDDIQEDWTLSLVGKVDAAHIEKLPKEDREAGATTWRVYPRTTDIRNWKKGEHRTLKLKIQAEPLPYEMSTLFYQWFEDKPRINGNPIRHGWVAGDEE